MNILLINYEYPPLGGGAANATMFIARALTELGHPVAVLTSHFGDLPRVARTDGFAIYRVKALRRSEDRSDQLQMASFMVFGVCAARRIAREQKIEAALAFFTIPSAPIAWWLWRTMDIPYVVSLRGGDVPGFMPSIARIHRFLTPFRRAVLRRAKSIVANSASLAGLSQRTDPWSVSVIPNGVDTDFFQPDSRRKNSAGDDFRICFVGRLSGQKNVHLLVQALARLRSSRARLDILGDGPKRSVLEKLAQQLGITDRIIWHGWQGKEAVAALYRNADCLVNPSAFEGLPNTVLEAMASGLPVIASDVVGNNEVVRSGETGLLFDFPVVEQLATCLESLIKNPQLGRSMGARGREIVLAEYSWRSVAQRYAALIDSAASEAHEGSVPPIRTSPRASR